MSWDAFLRLWRWGNTMSLLGVLQFLVCLALAMHWYAGGGPLSKRAAGYSFYGNYLSDLGRTVAWSGAPNDLSAHLFNTSLIVLAVAQVPFYAFLPLHASDRMIALLIATALGIASCVGLAGVGLTPYDIHLRAHVIWLLWWIVPLCMALVVHAWAIFGSEECSPLWALASLALALLVGAYAIRTAAQGLPPQSGDATSLTQSIALQKYVVFGCLLWYGVFSLRMLLVIRPPRQVRHARQDDVAAAEYLRRLGR